MIAGQNTGLSFADMKTMQLGQVLDYCIESINQRNRAEKKTKPRKRKATQADIDAFFGGSHSKPPRRP